MKKLFMMLFAMAAIAFTSVSCIKEDRSSCYDPTGQAYVLDEENVVAIYFNKEYTAVGTSSDFQEYEPFKRKGDKLYVTGTDLVFRVSSKGVSRNGVQLRMISWSHYGK